MDYENLYFDIHLKFVERKIIYAMGILRRLARNSQWEAAFGAAAGG